MANVDGFVRGETLVMFNENELDHLFEEEMDNIRHEVTSYRYILIYFIIYHSSTFHLIIMIITDF